MALCRTTQGAEAVAYWQLAGSSAWAWSTAGFGCCRAFSSANKELGCLCWCTVLRCATLPQILLMPSPVPRLLPAWGCAAPHFCEDCRGGEMVPRGAWWYLLVPAGLLTCTVLGVGTHCTVPEDPARVSESHLYTGMLPWDIRARNQPPGLWLRVLVWDGWALSRGTGIGFYFPSASLQGTNRLFWRCLAAFAFFFSRIELMSIAQKNNYVLNKNGEILMHKIQLSCDP